MTRLIIGCGYLGRRVAQRWLEAGQSVIAVTRSSTRAKELGQQGIEAVVADITQPQTLVKLPQTDTVLFSAGYDASSGLTRREHYVYGLRNVLKALSPKIQRFIFTGSTAVYGQAEGQLVDENSPCLPKTESGSALLEAESVLAASQFGSRAIILRLAGIYGPGRLLRRTKDLITGEPIIAKKNNYLNLIHVDDAADIVVAAETSAKIPCTYIVADGNPVKYRDYIALLSKLLGVACPPFLEPPLHQSDQTRLSTNKRLSNAKMLLDLKVQLQYPTYTEGLASVFAE